MVLKQQDVKAESVMKFGEHRKINELLSAQKKIKRIQVELTDDLHTHFKVACAKNDLKMSEVIIQIMQEWLKNNA